jgi:hypothetical protein
VTDMLWDPGSGRWTMISRSPFAPTAAAAASYVRMAASTCALCGSPLVAQIQRSKAGLILIIVGVVLTPVVIGVPLWILGLILRHGGKGKVLDRCPRCGYVAR